MTISSVPPAGRPGTVRDLATSIATSGGPLLDVGATADDKSEVGPADGFR